MSSPEFAEWIAYERIEPYGSVRDDQRFGVIASTLINVYKKRGSIPSKWNDFFPTYEDRQPKTWQRLLDKVKMFNQALNGKDQR